MRRFILILCFSLSAYSQFSQFIKIPAKEIRSIDGLFVKSGHVMLNVYHIISLEEQKDQSILLHLRNDKKPTTLILENVDFLGFFEKLKLFRSSFVLFQSESKNEQSIIINVLSIASIHESKNGGSLMYLTDGQTLNITLKQRDTFYKFMGMNIPEVID